MLKVSNPFIRTLALTAFISGFSFALPLHAQSETTTTTTQTTSTKGSSATHGEMHVEQRIKTLHDKLKITAAQEDEWSKVAQTMRDNEATIGQLVQARHQDPESRTAIDDIKSYQQITQAHADGMSKMVSSFEPLYNDMSADQKKNADQVFGSFEGHHHGKGMKKHS